MRVLGILNVTPDSFSDGGAHFGVEAAVAHAWEIVQAGADAIDIGGESTRPGSESVPLDEERARVLPVLEALGPDFPIPISVDTRRAAIASEAADRGATMINDTAALRDDPDLVSVVAERGLTAVLMHREGVPATMQHSPLEGDVVEVVRRFFEERVEAVVNAGVDPEKIVLDPGLGFGKRPEDNYRLIRSLDRLAVGGQPIMVGASRKSFLARFDDRPFAERLPGSLAFAAAAHARAAAWIRVHDTRETVAFLKTLEAIDSGVVEGARR